MPLPTATDLPGAPSVIPQGDCTHGCFNCRCGLCDDRDSAVRAETIAAVEHAGFAETPPELRPQPLGTWATPDGSICRRMRPSSDWPALKVCDCRHLCWQDGSNVQLLAPPPATDAEAPPDATEELALHDAAAAAEGNRTPAPVSTDRHLHRTDNGPATHAHPHRSNDAPGHDRHAMDWAIAHPGQPMPPPDRALWDTPDGHTGVCRRRHPNAGNAHCRCYRECGLDGQPVSEAPQAAPAGQRRWIGDDYEGGTAVPDTPKPACQPDPDATAADIYNAGIVYAAELVRGMIHDPRDSDARILAEAADELERQAGVLRVWPPEPGLGDAGHQHNDASWPTPDGSVPPRPRG